MNLNTHSSYSGRGRDSQWIILNRSQFTDLLGQASAMTSCGNADWPEQVAHFIGKAALFPHHRGKFILLSEYPNEDGNIEVITLPDSLDWAAYREIHSACARDPSVSSLSTEQREVICDNLFAEIAETLIGPVEASAIAAWRAYKQTQGN